MVAQLSARTRKLMLEKLATRPDPIVYFVVVLPLSLLVLALGYYLASRSRRPESAGHEWAFGVGQAAVFGLIAVILGFSFAFAASRYEARNALVVNEADAIRTAYLRAGFLRPDRAAAFRAVLLEYAGTRLQTYALVSDMRAETRSIAKSDALQERLWTLASATARRDPRSPFFVDLTRSVIDVIDVSEEQEAALNNHVPRDVLGIVLLSTLAGAFLLGLTFGRAKSRNTVLAVIFCALFAATVFTIVDLDHPQGGFVKVDVAPLQAVLDDMGRRSKLSR
jgi:uncharacterized membrane protein